MAVYSTQYTVKQVCDMLGAQLPEEFSYMANEKLTNLAALPKYMTKGCGYFLQAKNEEERNKRFNKAIEEGVKFIFAGPASKKFEPLKDFPHAIVDNVSDSIIKLSAQIRNDIGMKVIGVTGSLGKTSTKDIIYSVLKQKYITNKSLHSLNGTYPLFDNLQKISRDTEFFVQEFGIGAYGETMKKVLGCLPDAGVITIISDPHLDVFGTRENILAEKIKMITQAPKGVPAFLNYDDELLKEVKLDDHPIISYAVNNKKAEYYADNIKIFDDYITFNVIHGWKKIPIKLNSRSKENIGNAVVAAAIGEYFGLKPKEIAKGIESYSSGGIRQSLTNIGGYKLYMDAFNTAPVSLVGAVDVLERMPINDDGKRIAVIGDIPRLGDQHIKLHAEVGEKIGKSKLDIILCFGNDDAKIMAEAIKAQGKAVLYTDDRATLNKYIEGLITEKDITLYKGSVARLLARSVDQIYGTNFHVISGHYELATVDDYRIKIIHESEKVEEKMTAILSYNGKEEDINIPSTFKSTDVFTIYNSSFANNKRIKSVNIPSPIFNVGSKAFSGCTNLKYVKLAETIKVIEESAFLGCESLEEIVIPNGTSHIGDSAFKDCKCLKRIVIPSTVHYIGENAFEGCHNAKFEYADDSYASKILK